MYAKALAAEYMKRAHRYAASTMTEVRPDRVDLWAKHPTARKILLDPAGKSLDSAAFADLFRDAEMRGHDLVFVIGGHDGLPQAWRERADLLVALSAMTMPHELARAVLARTDLPGVYNIARTSLPEIDAGFLLTFMS